MAFLHQHFEGLGLSSKLSYQLPFYYGRKWICYLHPIKKEAKIELCFTRAHQFEDPSGLLEGRGRKQIKGLYLESLETIPLAAIDEIIAAALKVDQS